MSTRPVTQADIELYNSHRAEGWKLAQHRIIVQGRWRGLLTWWTRRKLREAERHLELAIEVNPTGWQAMWLLGKIHQRLGEHGQALDWLSRAHAIDPSQPDVAREAGLESLAVRDPQRGKEFFEAAIRASPRDAGLVANLALAQLLAGSVDDAHHAANEAVARDPKDPVSRAVLRAVSKVRSGKARIPHSIAEVQRL